MAAYEQVDVYVLNRVEPNDLVEGVLVRVYDKDGSSIFSEATTDSDGHVGFLLWSQEYSLRFYKFQVGFTQPQLIEVQSDVFTPGTTPNAFNVYADVVTPPVANDTRLCRASGYFRDITGAPHPALDIHFIGQFAPVLLEGAGVLSERRKLMTDENGYACIDLIRCAIYDAFIEGHEDQLRKVMVPDAPSVNLPDLLFPKVERVSFVPAGPWALTVDEELVVTPTVVTTAGVPLVGTAITDVTWSTSDDQVLSLTVGSETITLRGAAAGSAELQAERKDESIISIPHETIQGVPVAVTVT